LTGDERSDVVPPFNEGKRLDEDGMRDGAAKLGMIIGIFRRLKILYSDRFAYSWIKLPNTNQIFGGKRPVDFMIKGGIPQWRRWLCFSRAESVLILGSKLASYALHAIEASGVSNDERDEGCLLAL
jgi:hypothetical protein